ncbi:class I SAM-dependent methyltransferase [Streptacidiphilus cavernicola]|uniref:Class I SAM-dependent methyltransferase n=1 Tax=Streptacidiphilus cavernicola TaxID=3342716 RepID=A0ABV6VZ26_9ACTN
MAPEDVTAQVSTWYAEQFDEGARLSQSADGRLELLRTRELLGRYLPQPPADVLDVGGGPGAHAAWLTDHGYRVHLVDPVQRHLDQARARTGCTVELGDARHLTAADASWDVVLLLGPLYHLLTPEDRSAALEQARRVVRPGGIVAAAAISRFASLAEHTSTGNLINVRLRASVEDILSTQQYDGRRGFTAAHFHTADQLTAEMTAAGLLPDAVYAVEGPMWGLVKAVEIRGGKPLADDDPVMLSALAAARLADPYPELLSAASHLLAVCRVPPALLNPAAKTGS